MQDRPAGVHGFFACHRFQGRKRNFRGTRVGKTNRIELNVEGTGRQGTRLGRLSHQRIEIQNLEHPLEGHQRRHDVHPHIAQRGQWSIQLSQQSYESQQGPQRDSAVDDQVPAETIGHGGGQRRDEGECGEEPSICHGDPDSDVPDPTGPTGEKRGLIFRPSEQFDEQRPRNVEPLGHLRTHLSIQSHLLSRQRLKTSSHVSGREQEQRNEDQRSQGDLPGQGEHRDQDNADGNQIPEDSAECGRERLLRADHIAVES